ncbi:MAG TPA: hypothetical protein VEC60_08700 [Reyranella sp.]|nr:hypothetical protein [Reyranella sp.]
MSRIEILQPGEEPRPAGMLAWAFERPASLALLLPVTGLPLVAAAWALLSPPYLLSAEMTWDLMFNLAGAWHLRFGHVPHVDFHEPVGALTFLLTEAGFWLVGPAPKAIAAGTAIVAAAMFAMASFVAWRRLPLVPAILFVLFVCLLVLRPANVGDQPNAYSFAMTYNRYGWSGLALLALILFQPADGRRRGDRVEMAFSAVVLVALFYLKMTYFAVGLALVPVAVVACESARRRWRGWAAVFLLGLALPALPFNWPYLRDLLGAAQAGIVRDDAAFFFNDFAGNAAEYVPYFAIVGATAWLWWRRLAPARLFIASTVLLLASLALLSQNSQSHGVPLAIVAAFLLYDWIGEYRWPRILLPLVLLLPVASIVASGTSVAGYHARLGAGYLRMVDKTSLAGLAVPMEPAGLLADVAAGRDRDRARLFSRSRAIRPRYELSPYEYVETLLEAVELLERTGLASGRIAVLDQVDPFPFMLGLAPPRGGNLWSGAGAPTPTPEEYLGDADRVLIPRFTTNFAWTETAKAKYGGYVAEHFPHRVEGRSWIVLSRADRPR